MLKITHFEGLDNLMKGLIPLVPNSALGPFCAQTKIVEVSTEL